MGIRRGIQWRACLWIKRALRGRSSGGQCIAAAQGPPGNDRLCQYVKANPGKISFASYTPGTLSHVMGLQLNQLAGLDMNHVGYKGSLSALQDVMRGSVQFMFDGFPTSVPNIKGGKLRAFAVTSPQRSHVLPDVAGQGGSGHCDWLG